jgi:hypothetical protein
MKSITTKYVGPAKRGSRIIATDGDNRLAVNYDSGKDSDTMHRIAALELARRLGWVGNMAQGHTKDGCVFVFVESGNVFEISKTATTSAT